MSRASLFMALVLGASAIGCQPELERIEVTSDTTPPLTASITADKFTLTHGTAIAVTIVGIADGERADGDVTMPSTASLEVRERVTPDDPIDGTGFVLLGQHVGDGTLQISVSGTTGSLDIPFSVVAQP